MITTSPPGRAWATGDFTSESAPAMIERWGMVELSPLVFNDNQTTIVCTAKGVRLCRPSETVLDLLERWPPGPMAKEDGSPLIDAEGRRAG